MAIRPKGRRLWRYAFLVAAAGCRLPHSHLDPTVTVGTLVVSITDDPASASSLDAQIVQFVISGTGPGTRSFSIVTPSRTAKIENLALGDWTVTAEGLDASGQLQAKGTASAMVKAASQAAAVTIEPVLSYGLALHLEDSGVVVADSVQLVRVDLNTATQAALQFPAVTRGGAAQFDVTPPVDNPVAVSLSGPLSNLDVGTQMTVTASLPAGTTGDVATTWFLNGTPIGTGATATIGNGLTAGSYQLDVVALAASGQKAGMAGLAFSVVEPAPRSVSLAWDSNQDPLTVGYKLHYGEASGTYANAVDVGYVTTCTLQGLTAGHTYHIAATAYAADGTESGYSNEVVFAAPPSARRRLGWGGGDSFPLETRPVRCYHDYSGLIMIRTQIQLTEEQARKLKATAARRGTSVSELIRQGIDSVLAQETSPQPEELRARAIAVAGRFHSSLNDVARRHDDYLGEAFSK